MSNQKKGFDFKIKDCDAGWIRVEFLLGKESYGESMSECYSPLSKVKEWLETSITTTSPICFAYDQEGHMGLRTYIPYNDDEGYFEVYDDGGGEVDEIYARLEDWYQEEYLLGCCVKKRDLIGKIYNGFKDFFISEKYNPIEWEGKSDSMLTHLTHRINNLQLSHLLRELDWDDAVKITKEYFKELEITNENYIKEFLDENLKPENLPKDACADEKLFARRRKYIGKLGEASYGSRGYTGEKAESFFSLSVERFLASKNLDKEYDKFYFSPVHLAEGCFDVVIGVGSEAPYSIGFFNYNKDINGIREFFEKIIDLKKGEETEFSSNGKSKSLILKYKALDKEFGELTVIENENYIFGCARKEPNIFKVNKKQMIETYYSGIVYYFSSGKFNSKAKESRFNEVKEGITPEDITKDFFSKKIEKFLGVDGLIFGKAIIPRIDRRYNAPVGLIWHRNKDDIPDEDSVMGRKYFNSDEAII